MTRIDRLLFIADTWRREATEAYQANKPYVACRHLCHASRALVMAATILEIQTERAIRNVLRSANSGAITDSSQTRKDNP